VDLTVEVKPDGSGYWARVVELPGCFASGRSLDELGEAVGEAIGLYLRDRPASIGEQDLQVGRSRIHIELPGEE
jgi:predicted RNase H-like HicB family nuclease